MAKFESAVYVLHAFRKKDQQTARADIELADPRFSDTRRIKGRWQDFSLDMLLTLASRAGLEPQLRLAAWASASHGRTL